MINVIEKISFILILILPISLITGPAIPDISITLVGFIFLLIFYKKYFTYIFSHKWALVSIIFWIFLIFISIFSENQYLSFRESIIFIRILLIPIFIYFWILSDKNKINPVIFIIFLAVVFVCLDSIYQFTNYDPQTGYGKDIFGYIPNFYSRLTGPFKDLVPGAYISKFSFIGLAFIYLSIYNRGTQNMLTIIYLTLVGFVIYISNEKMALATFLLGFFILILFLKNKRIILLISLLCILFSIFLVNKFHPIYNDYRVIESTPYHLGLKIEKYFTCKNNKNKICKKIVNLQPSFMQVIKNFNQSAYGQIYKLGLKMWKDHPLNGVGLNNFTYLCNYDQRYKNLIKNYNCVTHPHNFYLQWLIETGIVGLLFFILYVFLIFKFTWKRILSSEYAVISLATISILFWPVMSTGSLLKNWMGISTFFIVGVCLALTKIKQKI